MSEVKNRKGNKIQTILQAVVLLIFIAAGWFLRGMMPGGAPMGGAPGGPMGGPAEPPKVVTETVHEGPAEPPREYVAHVEAIQTVEVSAQVTGYLEQVHFQEGSLVKEGDLLFTIEQEPYQARVALAEASLEQAKANLEGAKADLTAAQANLEAAEANLDRAEKYLERLRNADPRSVVQANLDTAISDEKQAKSQVLQHKAKIKQSQTAVQQMEALVHKAKADLELARIDLGYTEILSSIPGKIGKAVLTKGNYVGPSSGFLARIVQIDPIRVVFSMTDREYVTLLEETTKSKEEVVQVRIRLPNGKLYEGLGSRDFENNEMDRDTGTIAVHVRFSNDSGLLIPRSYVTIIMESKDQQMVPVIPQEAILLDQQGHYVFVVDEKGIVEQRRITVGAMIKDDQSVLKGLSAGETIIVHGIQKVQPGQEVTFMSEESQGGE